MSDVTYTNFKLISNACMSTCNKVAVKLFISYHTTNCTTTLHCQMEVSFVKQSFIFHHRV